MTDLVWLKELPGLFASYEVHSLTAEKAISIVPGDDG